MAADLRRALTERGIAFDTKPFRPHITLVRRAKLPRGTLPTLDFPAPAQAKRMTFYKSTLSAEGATYKPLYSVDLASES